MTRIEDSFAGKRIVVTGGVGSVGRAIVEQLRGTDAALIRVLDNNESGLFEMESELAADRRLDFYHCDITDEREMRRTFADMDLCFHTAALKHVPSCERSPFSAVSVNVLGCEVVGRVALAQGLEKVLFTSSDKAVNPTNVMGTSKLMGERLFTAMNFLRGRDARTLFTCTRFGNVAGSRGSVVPLFCRQIAAGGPVTVTDQRMTRFVMTMEDAASLVIESMALARGGEVFITKMPVLRIVDMARVMVGMLAPLHGHDPDAVPIEFTRPRPGEKLLGGTLHRRGGRSHPGGRAVPGGDPGARHGRGPRALRLRGRRSGTVLHHLPLRPRGGDGRRHDPRVPAAARRPAGPPARPADLRGERRCGS